MSSLKEPLRTTFSRWKSSGSNLLSNLLGTNEPVEIRPVEDEYLYRADNREPSEIAEAGGFHPRSISVGNITKGHVREYQRMAHQNPGFVSTASLEGAETFQEQAERKNLYRIYAKGLREIPQKQNIPLLQRLFYAEQDERMIAEGIPAERITLDDGTPLPNPKKLQRRKPKRFALSPPERRLLLPAPEAADKKIERSGS